MVLILNGSDFECWEPAIVIVPNHSKTELVHKQAMITSQRLEEKGKGLFFYSLQSIQGLDRTLSINYHYDNDTFSITK